MGILRDSPTSVSYPTLDPFEICDDVMIDPPSLPKVSAVVSSPVTESPAHRSVRCAKVKKTPQNKSSYVAVENSLLKKMRSARHYVLFCLLAVGVVTLFVKVKPWSYFSQPNLVFAYFEVRALDANGHPIAGAVVKNAGKRVGTTDSFGEWRRYMEVQLGSTIPISLTKRTPTQVLFVSKNFAVPPAKQDKNDIELRSSVQLMPAETTSDETDRDRSLNAVELTRATTAQTSDLTSIMPKQVASSTVTPEVNVSEQASADTRQKPPSVQPGPAAAMTDFESIWFTASDTRTEKELLPALVLRARELGLKVEKDAAWQIQVTNLIDKPAKMAKDGGGLILVGSMMSKGTRQSSAEFLRNYQLDARTTARGILFGLVHHVNKNILLTQAQGRWAAVLPKNSAQIWRLAPKQVVYSSGKAIKLSDEAFGDDLFRGFYLREQKDAPCAPDVPSCYVQTASFFETPPVAGWRRLRLTTPALGKDSVKVFVAGYAAKALGDHVFEYWGQERARANATILQNGRLILRGTVSASTSVAAVLGAQNLSRR